MANSNEFEFDNSVFPNYCTVSRLPHRGSTRHRGTLSIAVAAIEESDDHQTAVPERYRNSCPRAEALHLRSPTRTTPGLPRPSLEAPSQHKTATTSRECDNKHTTPQKKQQILTGNQTSKYPYTKKRTNNPPLNQQGERTTKHTDEISRAHSTLNTYLGVGLEQLPLRLRDEKFSRRRV